MPWLLRVVPPIALLRQAGGTVVQSVGGLAGWGVLVTEQTLARATAASGCGMEGLTAVGCRAPAGAGGAPMVGSACAHGDRPGIFERSGTGWLSVGPTLPGVVGPTEVVRLLGTGGGATALVAAHHGGAVDLIALWSTDGLQRWTVSSRLALAGGSVIATGSTADGGLVVTYRTSGGPGRGGGPPVIPRVAEPRSSTGGHGGGRGHSARGIRRAGLQPVRPRGLRTGEAGSGRTPSR